MVGDFEYYPSDFIAKLMGTFKSLSNFTPHRLGHTRESFDPLSLASINLPSSCSSPSLEVAESSSKDL